MTRWIWTMAFFAGVFTTVAPKAGATPPAASGCTTCAAPASCEPSKIPCPPYFYHYFEGGPKIKFKRGCPRPICDPCNLPHYGYFQTCWAPYPFPDDWNHCNTPTSSQMLPPPEKPLYAPRVTVPVPPLEPPPKAAPKKAKGPEDSGTELPPIKVKPEPETKPDLPSPKPLEKDKSPEKGPTVRLILSR